MSLQLGIFGLVGRGAGLRLGRRSSGRLCGLLCWGLLLRACLSLFGSRSLGDSVDGGCYRRCGATASYYRGFLAQHLYGVFEKFVLFFEGGIFLAEVARRGHHTEYYDVGEQAQGTYGAEDLHDEFGSLAHCFFE